MTFTYKLARRIARFRAPAVAAIVLALVACQGTDVLDPESSTPPTESPPSGGEIIPAGQVEMSTAFAGGIPMGTYALPVTEYGSRYNGGLLNSWPEYLLDDLAAIKARGGKVVLSFTGNEHYFLDSDGHFSLSKWKERVNRFKSVNFNSYITDGTIIGHYLIDEPNDASNWNGEPVPGTTVEELAKYSKSIWPNLPTIVRVDVAYLRKWSGIYHYLDAAWAQYLYRRGDVNDYIRQNVADAQKEGLALVVGLNLLRGGNPNGTEMTAGEVATWGSALLSSSYPCAFISWQYNASYLSTSAMKDAMDQLRSKAQNRSTKSCRSSGSEPDPSPEPSPSPSPDVDSPLPYGLFQAPLEEYSTRWTGAVYRADPADLTAWLGRARTAKMKVITQLAPTAQSKNADGTFSLTKWKAQVDRYRTLSLGQYIGDKTLYLHYLVEQPTCASCWGGKAISWGTIEEMARYSKSIWPALPTSVRVTPTKLAAASFRWTYLDAGWAEYNTKLGDPRKYLAAQVEQAKLEGLGLVAGLNLLDGSGWNTPSMTASQIKQFGTIFATDPSICALVGRRYDQSYLSQSGIRQALDSVAVVAKRRAAGSCVR